MKKRYPLLALCGFLLIQHLEYNDELVRDKYCSDKQVQAEANPEEQEIDAIDIRICPALGGTRGSSRLSSGESNAGPSNSTPNRRLSSSL